MQLKFVPLGLIASLLISVSARSIHSESSLQTQDVIDSALNSHLVARCASGCCSSSCSGGSSGSHGSSNGDFDFGDFGDAGKIIVIQFELIFYN